MVLFAIMLPLFLVVGAIVIDISYWWVSGKKAQIAADACALAAARDLPATWNRTECEFAGQDYVIENLPLQVDDGDGVRHTGYDGKPATQVISPYDTKPYQVEATVRLRVRTFFGRYVGLEWINLTRRAVAERQEGSGNWAIYAHDPEGCDAGNGLEFDGGAGIQINGRVHSNSRYHVNSGSPKSGDQFWALEGTINKKTCVASLNPKPEGAAYGTGPEPRDHLPEDGVFEDWPAWYTPEQFGWPYCSGANFSARNINIKGDKVELKKTGPSFNGPDINIPHSGVVPAGTYCATESITTSDTIAGTITLLSPQITISGNSTLLPHAHDVLFFAVPNWDSDWAPDFDLLNDGTYPSGEPIECTNRDLPLKLNGDVIAWAGTIFHPCGRIEVNSGKGVGGNDALVGTILGYQVKVNQNDFKMKGESDFGADILLALVE